MKEVLGIALAAAVAAVALPRALMSDRFVHVRVAHAQPRAIAPTAPRSIAQAAREPVDAEPAATSAGPAPDVDGPPESTAPRADATRVSSARVPRGSIVRRNGRWVADLRALPPVRTVLAGTSVTPPGEGPQREGYLITQTDRRGILSSAGIRPGDVLIAVDGLPLRNPDDALEVVSRLRHETRATLVFQRGSSRYSVPIELVGAPPAGLLAL